MFACHTPVAAARVHNAVPNDRAGLAGISRGGSKNRRSTFESPASFQLREAGAGPFARISTAGSTVGSSHSKLTHHERGPVCRLIDQHRFAAADMTRLFPNAQQNWMPG